MTDVSDNLVESSPHRFPTSYHRGALVFDPRVGKKVASLNVALIFADLNMKNSERDGRAWREMGKIANLVESATVGGEMMRRTLEDLLHEKNKINVGEFLPCHVCGHYCQEGEFERITHAYNIGEFELRETRRVHKLCFTILKVPYVETTQIVDRDGITLIAPDGTPMAARGQMVRPE